MTKQQQFAFEEGIDPTPNRTLLYGPAKMGKTTFASRFPKPFFFDPELGSKNFRVGRFTKFDPKDDAANWDLSLSFLRDFCQRDHDYETFVVDTADKFESFAIASVCKNVGGPDPNDKKKYIPVNTLDKVNGGYGKGEDSLVEQMRIFLGLLDQLNRFRDMEIVVLSHERQMNISANGDDYKRWCPQLKNRVVELFMKEMDYVLHVQPHTITEIRKGEFGSTKTIVKNSPLRYLFTAAEAERAAGCRLPLPRRIEFHYDVYADAMINAGNPAFLALAVADKIATVTSAKIRAKMTETLKACGPDIGLIVEFEGRVDEYLAKQAEKAAEIAAQPAAAQLPEQAEAPAGA